MTYDLRLGRVLWWVLVESEDGRMVDGAVGQAARRRVLVDDGHVRHEGPDRRGLGQLIIIRLQAIITTSSSPSSTSSFKEDSHSSSGVSSFDSTSDTFSYLYSLSSQEDLSTPSYTSPEDSGSSLQ